MDFSHGLQGRCSAFIWVLSELELNPGRTEENVTAVSQDGLFRGWKNSGNKALMDQTGLQHNLSLPNKGNVPRLSQQGQLDRERVIPMNSDYIYIKKAPGNLILNKTPNENVLPQMQTPISQPQTPHPVSSEVPALLWVLPITSQ